MKLPENCHDLVAAKPRGFQPVARPSDYVVYQGAVRQTRKPLNSHEHVSRHLVDMRGRSTQSIEGLGFNECRPVD